MVGPVPRHSSLAHVRTSLQPHQQHPHQRQAAIHILNYTCYGSITVLQR